MKIGRGFTNLGITLTTIEYDTFRRALGLKTGDRLRVKASLLNDEQIMLQFGHSDGYSFCLPHPDKVPNGDWRVSHTYYGSGTTLKRLPLFGLTKATYSAINAKGEVLVSIPTTMVDLRTRSKKSKGKVATTAPKASPTPVRVATPAPVAIITGRAANVGRAMTDSELIGLKTALNEAISQGFTLKFTPAGELECFERRVG